ncbi:hypothetical protein FGO68_gene9313 [Halteria grandinella]|uniref:Uncharacterized protein n=1 Tax=Halteria grandinella TaxID=5974 RepID=A0A8J8NPL7_HALGN|nr:hypothetical protein FGO68_gene9313 [Halteria grandinella]
MISQNIATYRDITNNKIQERQDLCSCQSGLRVRFYCYQQNCKIHTKNIFYCDECFSSMTESGQGHQSRMIHKLLSELKEKWMKLQELEGKTYHEVCFKFKAIQSMAEYLEQFILSSNNTFKGKRLCNDMANFHLFDSEFKSIFAEVEGYMNEDKTAKLYSFDETYN